MLHRATSPCSSLLMSAQRYLQNSKARPEMLWVFVRLWSFHGQQLPKSASTRHFCGALVKERGKEILRGCSNVWEDQHAQNCHTRDAGHAPEPILVQPLVSSLLPQPWLQGHGGRKRAGPHPSFLLERRRKMKAKDGAGTAESGMPEKSVN